MRTMIDKRFSISLTATIAELYEAQNHYYAAYIVYWFLYQTEKSEKYSCKLEEIKEKIYEANELAFDPLICRLFTGDEMRYLGILPKNLYKQFAESEADLQKDELEAADNIEGDEKEEFRQLGKGIGLEWQRFIAEERKAIREEASKEDNTSYDTVKWNNARVSDFVTFLDNYVGEKKELDQIKLSTILKKFLNECDRDKEGTSSPLRESSAGSEQQNEKRSLESDELKSARESSDNSQNTVEQEAPTEFKEFNNES